MRSQKRPTSPSSSASCTTPSSRARRARATRASRAPRATSTATCALLESGQATQQELLELVATERARVSGPATREVAMDTASEIAAAEVILSAAVARASRPQP